MDALDLTVLRRAYLNSYFQTGLKNLDGQCPSLELKRSQEHALLQNLVLTSKK